MCVIAQFELRASIGANIRQALYGAGRPSEGAVREDRRVDGRAGFFFGAGWSAEPLGAFGDGGARRPVEPEPAVRAVGVGRPTHDDVLLTHDPRHPQGRVDGRNPSNCPVCELRVGVRQDARLPGSEAQPCHAVPSLDRFYTRQSMT